MISQTNCPDANVLESLADGTIGDNERASVEQHTRDCPRCQESLNRLSLAKSQKQAVMATMNYVARAETEPEPEPGESSRHPSIPGYEILDVIGKGGMGVVYRARDRRLKRTVAIKMLRSREDVSEMEIARFRTEATALAELQHPNIVHLYESGEVDGLPFFALEFVDGLSLDTAIRSKPLPFKAAAEVVEAVARAIECAHGLGILHRDLKPANILVQLLPSSKSLAERPLSTQATLMEGLHDTAFDPRSVVPKVTDFGLARRQDDASQTKTGQMLGTPGFMAPEQVRSERGSVGPGVDIYGLGSLLYALLTGRPPFMAASIVETVLQVLHADPLSPRVLCPDVPRAVETICLKCLEKEPGRRYSSAAEVAHDLRAFLDGRQTVARPPSVLQKTVRWCRKNALSASLAAAILVIGLTASLFVARFQRQHEKLAIDDRVKLAARERFLAVSHHLDSELEVVRLLRSLLETRGQTTRGEFDQFCRSALARHGSLAALEWVPRVAAADRTGHEAQARADGLENYQISWRMHDGQMVAAGGRDEFFPVYYASPMKGNERAIGFDIASEADRARALQAGRDENRDTITKAIKLVQDTDGGLGFLACVPVYDHLAADSVEERRAKLRGYAVGVFRINALMKQALNLFNDDLAVVLVDRSNEDQVLFTSDKTSDKTEKATEAGPSAANGENVMRLGGREWQVRAIPSETFLASHRSSMPAVIFTCGAALTVLLSIGVLFISSRTRA